MRFDTMPSRPMAHARRNRASPSRPWTSLENQSALSRPATRPARRVRRSWSGIRRRSSPWRPRRSNAIRWASLQACFERKASKSGRPSSSRQTASPSDHHALDGKALDGRDDRREGFAPIPSGSRLQAHPAAFVPGDDAITVPLELVNPLRAGRHRLGQDRLTGTDETGWRAPVAARRERHWNTRRL